VRWRRRERKEGEEKEDEKWSVETSTWTFQHLLHYLHQKRGVTKASINDLLSRLQGVAREVAETAREVNREEGCNSKLNLPKIIGIDVQLDDRLKPWLLEVNRQPGLKSAAPAMVEEKKKLVRGVWSMTEFWSFDLYSASRMLCLDHPYLSTAVEVVEGFCTRVGGACWYCASKEKMAGAAVGMVMSTCEREGAIKAEMLPILMSGGDVCAKIFQPFRFSCPF